VPGQLPEAANSVGGWLAGVLPHRGAAGTSVGVPGLDARAMLANPRRGYVLLGVEPEHDCWNASGATRALAGAGFVVALTPWAGAALKATAHVLLPIAPFTETSGTFVNAEGCWQSFAGAAAPYRASRPGWKVLRVLGNLLGLEGFEYAASEEVRDELRRRLDGAAVEDRRGSAAVAAPPAAGQGLERIGEAAIYGTDALVRRAGSLQKTPDAQAAATLRMNAAQAQALDVSDAEQVRAIQGDDGVVLALRIDERVPDGCAWIPSGTAAAAVLGAAFGSIRVERA
jgi:NADH-quinone oxidoreductase subunit G